MDISKIIKNLDPDKLSKQLGDMKPLEMLTSLGVSLNDAENIMNGDTSSLVPPFYDILDFSTIIERFKGTINLHLIKYFFKVAKEKIAFTDDEINAYNEAWINWFDLVFKVGQKSIFCISPELEDQTIIIQKGEEFYLMTKHSELDQIIFLGNNLNPRDLLPLV
jgi:hypothetical protein